MSAIDPICGMSVNHEKAPSSVKDGVSYYFCCQGCKRAFESEKTAEAPVLHGTYTCPMHPEVVSDKPGACPICGMALEPRTATLDDQPNAELIDMQRRLIVATILTIPLLIGAMSSKSGMAQRIAYTIVTRIGTSYSRLLLAFIAVDFLMTFLVPSGIARVASPALAPARDSAGLES